MAHLLDGQTIAHIADVLPAVPEVVPSRGRVTLAMLLTDSQHPGQGVVQQPCVPLLIDRSGSIELGEVRRWTVP